MSAANPFGQTSYKSQWKSGYFSRSVPAIAVDCALRGESGVIGHDEERGNLLRAIEFPRIKGGKPFDTTQPWFDELLAAIGQDKGHPVTHTH